jgi:L,D-peptidoglycan transpeptidase YkuD (ErfK/YbiS/YcfS/YnhG family)
VGTASREGQHGSLPFRVSRLGNSGQLLIVSCASWNSTHAVLEAYERDGESWSRVLEPVEARIGSTGMVEAERRRQGTGTTPAGMFTLTEAFGLAPDPGTALPYSHVTSSDHWWVCDPGSPHYNQLRLSTAGGFRPTDTGRRASERIVDHAPEYDHVVVVDFNRPHPDRSLGSGIFIRGGVTLPTDGGVGIAPENVLRLLAWLDPARRPVVTIGTERFLAEP